MAFHEYSSFTVIIFPEDWLSQPVDNVQYVVGHLIRDMHKLRNSKCCLG